MKQSDTMENRDEENFYTAMKLEKYGLGLKLKTSGFVSFLAWTGMMLGVLGILFSVEFFIHPSETISPFYPVHPRQPALDLDWMSYTVGVVGMFTSAVWLALHLALRKRNVDKDFQGIKKILKIKCYITGALEITTSLMGITVFAVLAVLTSEYPRIQLLREGILFIFLVFACCKVHGVRKDNNRLINSYILFKLIIYVVFFAMGISLLVIFSGRGCIPFIFGMFLVSFFYVYYLGALVVLYNFNYHCSSKTNYKNLAFTNQTSLDGNAKCPA